MILRVTGVTGIACLPTGKAEFPSLCLPEIQNWLTPPRESVDSRTDGRSPRVDLAGLFWSRPALQAEIVVLRHQLNVLRRRSPQRVTVGNLDRLVFVGLNRLAPKVLDALKILQPETVIHWHRAGFRAHWRWKSRRNRGRPKVPADLRRLILEMSIANPLWGAPRIHGELLKLAINVGQTRVAKYIAKKRRLPSQGWTFLRNHADGIASIDMFVVPTIYFGRCMYFWSSGIRGGNFYG